MTIKLELEFEPLEKLSASKSGNVASHKLTKASIAKLEKAISKAKAGQRLFRPGQIAIGFNVADLPEDKHDQIDLTNYQATNKAASVVL